MSVLIWYKIAEERKWKREGEAGNHVLKRKKKKSKNRKARKDKAIKEKRKGLERWR